MDENGKDKIDSLDSKATVSAAKLRPPKGRRRLHRFVSDNRIPERSWDQQIIVHIISAVLIVTIMYFDLILMQRMSQSYDPRTYFATLLITLCLPAVLLGVSVIITRRIHFGDLALKSLFGIVVLSFFLRDSDVFNVLWFVPACFGIGYFTVLLMARGNNRKRGVKLPPMEDGELDVKEGQPRKPRSGSESRRQNAGWANTYYSYFKMKKN